MTDREVMQQALEALREFGYHGSSPRWERTADALKATLEQPEQRKTLTYEDAIQLAREAGFNKNELASMGDYFVRLCELAVEAAYGIQESKP